MVVFEDKHYVIDASIPNTDFTGGEALYVVPDGSGIATDIIANAPYFDFITDDKGTLTGIKPTAKPTPTPSTTVTVDDISIAVAELAEKQENDKIALEEAIAELAETVVGGE